MDLPHRIAIDVISRGTEEVFLAGTDAGVLYGIGRSEADINAPPGAPAPAASGGGGGSTASAGSGLFANLAAADMPKDLTLVLRSKVTAGDIELPRATVTQPSDYNPTVYALAGLPSGLTNSANASTDVPAITGTPLATGSFTVTYTASQTETAPAEGEEADVLSTSLKFTIEVVRDAAPAFADDASIGDVLILTEEVYGPVTLPTASGGNGTLTYTITPALPDWLKFENGALSGMAPDAVVDEVKYTYTVADSDNNPEAADTDTLTCVVEIEADTQPTLKQEDIKDAIVAGTDIVAIPLVEAVSGNAPYTYEVSGLPSGLSFDADDRQITGRTSLPEGETSRTYSVTYEATDRDGDSVTDTFTMTVNAS